MPTGNPCVDRLVAGGKIDEADAAKLIGNIGRLAAARAAKDNGNLEKALADVQAEILQGEKTLAKVQERNTLLNIRAKNRVKQFVRQFPTIGEGLQALFEGSARAIRGGRHSIDAQAKALHQQYFGRLVDGLETNGVLGTFKSGKLNREIYQEMGELGKPDGRPGISGSEEARKIAQVLDSVTEEMVQRQNQAGSYITRLPGYITRQTHDNTAIRLAGHADGQKLDKEVSFNAWAKFILPLLDHEKTFRGNEPREFLRLVHEGLYSGIHGPPTEAEISYASMYPNNAKKISASRLLHFKDADSAFAYNQEFGIRNLQDSIFSDLFYRSRNIAVMENLGPNPEATFRQITRELSEEHRELPDAAKQLDSMKDWRIDAAFREALGLNDNPVNVSLQRRISAAKMVIQMAKMGGVVLSSFADKAFLQAEAAYQGMKYMDVFAKQLTGMFPRDKEQQQFLRLLGVGLDGLIGNTVSRFSLHDTVSGTLHRIQRRFFDVNFLNWWTDANKAAMAELMVSHLAEHSDLEHANLPPDLKRVLDLYNIGHAEWNAIRSLVERDDNGHVFIWPEKSRSLSDDLVKPLLGRLSDTPINRQRVLNDLETRLRSYIADRVDYAVPTPGAQQKKYATFNTQAGTPLGEVIRLLTMFKSFPMTILTKVLARDVYGRGSESMAQWLASDHKGKFWIAHTIAAGTILGYFSGAVRDLLAGKTPKQLTDEDGNIRMATLNDAALRSGALGILGDVLLSEYDRGMRGFTTSMAGPVLGQLDPIASIGAGLVRGKDVTKETGKLFLDNTPFINLFYIRPVLNYFVLWNLQEMMDPGSTRKSEINAQKRYGQEFIGR